MNDFLEYLDLNPQSLKSFVTHENIVLQLLKHKYNKYGQFPDTTCKMLAILGHLSCVRFVHEHGGYWDEQVPATCGSLSCLQYLHEHGCPWDKNTCTFASLHGNLECLIYAHEHGCPWDRDAYLYVKNLEILKYLHENGCPPHPFTCNRAVKRGDLSCLRYAHEHGCPWDDFNCHETAQIIVRLQLAGVSSCYSTYYVNILQYIHEHKGCDGRCLNSFK